MLSQSAKHGRKYQYYLRLNKEKVYIAPSTMEDGLYNLQTYKMVYITP